MVTVPFSASTAFTVPRRIASCATTKPSDSENSASAMKVRIMGEFSSVAWTGWKPVLLSQEPRHHDDQHRADDEAQVLRAQRADFGDTEQRAEQRDDRSGHGHQRRAPPEVTNAVEQHQETGERQRPGVEHRF